MYLDTHRQELYFAIVFKVSVGMVFGKVSYGQFDENVKGEKVRRVVKAGDKAPIELRELRQLVDEAK